MKAQPRTAKKSGKKRAAKKPKDPKGKPLTVTALAKLLGTTTKTMRVLRRTQGAPAENDFDAWEVYMTDRAAESGHTMQVSDAFMPQEIRRLRAKLLRAQAGKEEATMKLKELELQRTRENLVPMGDAKKAVKRALSPLRELLDQMPKACGGKANPADSVHGEEAIREHLDGLFQAMERELKE